MNINPLNPGDIFISQNILGQVTVSFSMTSPDWEKLEKSEAWQEIHQFLLERQRQNIRLCHQEQTGLLESGLCRSPEQKHRPIRAGLIQLWSAIFGMDKEHR